MKDRKSKTRMHCIFFGVKWVQRTGRKKQPNSAYAECTTKWVQLSSDIFTAGRSEQPAGRNCREKGGGTV